MKKRLVLAVLVLSLVFTSAFAMLTPSAVSDAEFVAPVVFIPEYMPTADTNLLIDTAPGSEEAGLDTVLGAGTRYEHVLHAEFLPTDKASRPMTIQNQSFIVVHNTGSYPASADALNMFQYCHNTTADVSWHFSVGNDGVYQQIPVNEKGWHAGGSYWNATTTQADNCPVDNFDRYAGNSNSVGIETCVDGFPATGTASGEMWDSPEMYEWYETHYDKTATYLAQLVATICVNMNFNPYTQIVQHFNTAAKNCPMQMRYVFGTNAQFIVKGTYYKVFLDRMYDYYEALGGSFTSEDTIKNVYYNATYTSFEKGLYSSNAAITAYVKPYDGATVAGTIAAGQVADVQVVSHQWGKTTLADGTKAWIKLAGLTYNEGALGTYRTADNQIINVTNINGDTATYEGGTASLATLTKVYKVTVESDTVFGSESKYLAVGETFNVAAVAAVAPNLFDIWEVTYGAASIADKNATETTITVLNSDIVVKATYRDKYDLKVTSGRGSGRYAANAVIDIASSNKVGYKFSHWTLVSGEGTFADANASSTTFTIGSADTVIEARYEVNKELDVTGLENYALNKSYTTMWKNKATDESSYYTSWGNFTDTDLVRLTDGLTATLDSYQAPQMVAFIGTGSTLEFSVDLGKTYDISKLLICDLPDSGGSWNDLKEGSIKIKYSVDNVTWNTIDFFEDQLFFSYNGDKRLSNVFTHGIELGDIECRYFYVSFQSSQYVMALTEIKVFGPAGQDTVVDDSSDDTSDDTSIEDTTDDTTVDDTTEEPVLWGDANGDNKLSPLDASLTLQYNAKLVGEDKVNVDAVDVNGDGRITPLDASLILQFDAKLITEFPVEK